MFSRLPYGLCWPVLALCLGVGCSSSETAPPPESGPPPAASPDKEPSKEAPDPKPVSGRGENDPPQPLLTNSTTKPVPPPSPKQMAKAKRLLEKGMGAYGRGDYDRAEGYLKEAIAIYPFLPDANLALGKILLIRGSATRDMALMNSARLMFEMARALNPDLREPELLLELFTSQPE